MVAGGWATSVARDRGASVSSAVVVAVVVAWVRRVVVVVVVGVVFYRLLMDVRVDVMPMRMKLPTRSWTFERARWACACIEIALACAWTWARCRRRAFVRGASRRRASDGWSRDAGRVTVILPTRRATPAAMGNWRTQLRTTHAGDVEFIFVVESASDDARAAVEAVIEEELGGDEASTRFSRSGRVVEAGRATTSSQKIHNMLAGVRAMHDGSEYVLFLDDDVETRPGTIECLARALAEDDDSFLATGYPFDVPYGRDAKMMLATANIATYMYATYHLVLIIAFSQGRWTKNVWGGCAMLRADDLRRDAYGCVSAYAKGGYSDDLILASIADREGMRVLCPSNAVFPSYMPDAETFGAWWNYIHRQVFVMDTYADAHNRMVNHFMLAALVLLSIAFTVGFMSAVHELVVYAARHVAYGAVASEDAVDVSSVVVFLCFILAMTAARAMYVTLGRVCDADGDAGVASRAIARISWLKMSVAFVLAYALAPLAALRVMVSDRIVWAHATYIKHKGSVRRVD